MWILLIGSRIGMKLAGGRCKMMVKRRGRIGGEELVGFLISEIGRSSRPRAI